ALRPPSQKPPTQRRRRTKPGMLAIRVLRILRPAPSHRPTTAIRRCLRTPLQPRQATRCSRHENPRRVPPVHQLRKSPAVSYVLNPDTSLTFRTKASIWRRLSSPATEI